MVCLLPSARPFRLDLYRFSPKTIFGQVYPLPLVVFLDPIAASKVPKLDVRPDATLAQICVKYVHLPIGVPSPSFASVVLVIRLGVEGLHRILPTEHFRRRFLRMQKA